MSVGRVAQIVGVDCAAQPKNVGVAYATAEGVQGVAARLTDPAAWVVERVDWTAPVLFALDAPLGWPASMARELGAHRPGAPLRTEPNALFRRVTDHAVRELTGKVPLDVGADRIARAAHGALRFLDRVRSLAGRPLPILWSVDEASESGVIEVYPAATLRLRGLPDAGYKSAAAKDEAVRRSIVEGLREELAVGDARPLVLNADALDAVVCVAAGLDFLAGRCVPPPPDEDVRATEGWIWVRRRVATHRRVTPVLEVVEDGSGSQAAPPDAGTAPDA